MYLAPRMLMGNDAVQIIDALNGCIDRIRVQGQSTRLRSAVDRFVRLSRKNFRSLTDYIKSLFDQYARLLVVRIDLGYRKGMFWPNGSDNASIPYPEVKAHRLKLMRNLNRKLPDLVGYALKMEYGLEKGYHYHLAIFLDGSNVREDVTIGKLVGEEWWDKTITNGKGLHYNCNAFKRSYKSCGIGMVHHADTLMREGLRMAALYLTKTDSLIQFVTPDRDRTFWKGNKPKEKANSGRPRTKGLGDNSPKVDANLPCMPFAG